MIQHLLDNDLLLKIAFNAIPFPIMVTDDNIRMLFWNAAALQLLGNEELLQQRGGEVLHCIHTKDAEEGCGYGPHCGTCVVRNSVIEAGRGSKVYRKKTILNRTIGNTVVETPLLVTTSPFRYENKSLILLILEDIHELMSVGSLLPICSNCKKIRSASNQWDQVEVYIKKNIVDVDFTHGLCPDCARRYFPDTV
ncbi:MAG: PAS domain-containing protein [Ignavibacteriae bacterium]|nr:MAG: PAS domain-containing protein [Ignavibacteriota bacterium]